MARAERESEKVLLEEDRAIRLYVSGKIAEVQLDHQREFITERLESARRNLNDWRARESAQAGQMEMAERVLEWAELMGDGLDDLPEDKRREVLRLLLEEVTINREYNLTFTLAIPSEDLESIAPPVSGNRNRPPLDERNSRVPGARHGEVVRPAGVEITLGRRPDECALVRPQTSTVPSVEVRSPSQQGLARESRLRTHRLRRRLSLKSGTVRYV